MQGCRNVLLSGQKLKSFSDSSFLGPCIFFPCCLSLNSCLWLILCSALSKHFWVLGKLRNCSLSSNLCPFLSSFPRTPLLLNHLICIFTFLNGCQNVSSITGFTYMLFVLFPDVSLFFFFVSCGSLVRICPQVIITLIYFLPVSIASCYLVR